MDHLRELSVTHIDPRGLGSVLLPVSQEGKRTGGGGQRGSRAVTMVMSATDTSTLVNSTVNPKLNKIFTFSNWSHLLQNLK